MAKGQVRINHIKIVKKAKVSEHAADGEPVEAGGSDGLLGRKAKKVIAAALRLIGEQSFHHASMEAIAREAGVSKATL